jgi:hypothetical protein
MSEPSSEQPPNLQQPMHEAIVPVLVSSQLLRTMADEKDGEAARRYYTVNVDEPLRLETSTLFYCQIEVARVLDEVASEQFKATYLFGFESAEDLSNHPQFRSMIERLVKSTVWLRFRDLFALTTSQGDMDFPQLPSEPDEIKFTAE